MACSNNSPRTYTISLLSSRCTDCTSSDGCGSPMDGRCVYYGGPALNCSGIETNDSLEVVIQKLDAQVCFIAGNYGNYQFNCLSDWYGTTITQEAQFVQAITGYACETNDMIVSFVNEAFPEYQTIVDTRFIAIEIPGIECMSTGGTVTDTIQTVLSKYCTKFDDIDAFDSLSGVNWNSCFTVSSTPTNLTTAFNTLIDQLCQTKTLASGASLPTFNNTTECLAGTSNDSLVTTIALIKTRLCEAPIFDVTLVGWGCLDDTATDLQESFQTVVTKVSTLAQNIPTYSSDFVVTQTDSSDACSGLTISLATSLTQDRFVALNDADTSPGTLVDKVSAGTGITLTPSGGTLEISASGTADTYQVKADSVDDDPDYLDAKLNGSEDNGVTLSPTYNAGTKQVDLILNVNPTDLFNALLDRLLLDTELYQKFCQRVSDCPSPCAAPTNVQAVQLTTTTTIAP